MMHFELMQRRAGRRAGRVAGRRAAAGRTRAGMVLEVIFGAVAGVAFWAGFCLVLLLAAGGCTAGGGGGERGGADPQRVREELRATQALYLRLLTERYREGIHRR